MQSRVRHRRGLKPRNLFKVKKGQCSPLLRSPFTYPGACVSRAHTKGKLTKLFGKPPQLYLGQELVMQNWVPSPQPVPGEKGITDSFPTAVSPLPAPSSPCEEIQRVLGGTPPVMDVGHQRPLCLRRKAGCPLITSHAPLGAQSGRVGLSWGQRQAAWS